MYILEINHGGGEIHRYFLLPGEEYTIGRKECRVLLPNAEAQPSISRHHATISVSAIPKYAAMDPKAQVEIVLRDFSKHGTFVDRERVGHDNARFIYPEDRIRFGLRVTARVLPVTLPLIVSPNMDQRSLEVLVEAAVQIGALIMEDHVPAPSDFYQKHINCVGFLFVSDDKFTMDASMMEALGFGYTLTTTNYVLSLVREIKANDRLMPSEFSVPVPPIPASMALRSVHYRRPVQTFYSPLEFLSVGSPVVSTVFQDCTVLIPEDRLLETAADVIALFGGVAEKVDAQDLARYRTIAITNPQALALLTESTFNRVSELVITCGGSRGDLASASDDNEAVVAGLRLYRCGICLIPEENIQLALYRDDPLELKDKTGACYLQRAREDVEADASLVTAPSTEGTERLSTGSQGPTAKAADELEAPAARRSGGSPSVESLSPSTSSAATGGGSPPSAGPAAADASAAATAGDDEAAVGSRRRSTDSGLVTRPTQLTVALPEKSEGSATRAEPAEASVGSTKTSQPRGSVGSLNGRSSAHLPPKTGGVAPPASAVSAPAPVQEEVALDAEPVPLPTSARSIGPDDEKELTANSTSASALDLGATSTSGKNTPTTSAITTPARASAIPPRHQPLSSAVAINRRVAERRRSLGGTPLDTSHFSTPQPTTTGSTAGKSPSNRLPPKNVVTGGSSARKTPGLAMDASSTPTRRLPAASAPPVPMARGEPLETPNNLGHDDEDADGRRSGSQAEKRPVVLHAASQVGHSPNRQRVEPVKISTSYSDRRYSLPRGSAGPEDDGLGEGGRQGSQSAAANTATPSTAHADPAASADPSETATRGTASRIKRQAVRRESVANRASVTRRASQTVSYQRSDSSRNAPLESASGRVGSRTVGSAASSSSSVPRSGRAARTGHHPHSLASPVPQRETSTATLAGGELGSMPELAPAPSSASARRRRSGSLIGSNNGLPPPVPPPGSSAAGPNTTARAASVMPISNSSLNEGYHADAQLGLQCESFSKNFLQGFTSETEKVSRTVLRQTYMDSTSKQFFEDGLTRIGDFLEYMHQHEKEIAPMYSTEVTRRSCYDIRQNTTYVLRKIKGTFDSVKAKTPSNLQHCRDVLNNRQRSPTRPQARYNSVSGHTSDSAYRRANRV